MFHLLLIMKLFKVHYFDHVLNRGKIQDIYAKMLSKPQTSGRT